MSIADELNAQMKAQSAIEEARRAHEANMEKRRTKIDLVRLAKEVLVENSRHKPAEEAVVTAADITAFAEELIRYIGD